MYKKIVKLVNWYETQTIAATGLVDLKKIKAWVREKGTVSPVGRFIGEEAWTICNGFFDKSLQKHHWDYSWVLAWALCYSWGPCRTAKCPRQMCHRE